MAVLFSSYDGANSAIESIHPRYESIECLSELSMILSVHLEALQYFVLIFVIKVIPILSLVEPWEEQALRWVAKIGQLVSLDEAIFLFLLLLILGKRYLSLVSWLFFLFTILVSNH